MDGIDDLDFVGWAIVKAFMERFPNDKGYIAEKIEHLRGGNKFNSLIYLVNLDDEMLKHVARGLNCDHNELRQVSKFCMDYL